MGALTPSLIFFLLICLVFLLFAFYRLASIMLAFDGLFVQRPLSGVWFGPQPVVEEAFQSSSPAVRI